MARALTVACVKEIEWMGSTLRDLKKFPPEARAIIGRALRLAQNGDLHPDAEKMKGKFSKLIEIRADDKRRERTFRCIYTAKIGDSIYALHAFNKKSRAGRETPQKELNLIEQRYKEAKKALCRAAKQRDPRALKLQ